MAHHSKKFADGVHLAAKVTASMKAANAQGVLEVTVSVLVNRIGAIRPNASCGPVLSFERPGDVKSYNWPKIDLNGEKYEDTLYADLYRLNVTSSTASCPIELGCGVTSVSDVHSVGPVASLSTTVR